MFVYVITNNITGKIYIGQHSGTNLQNYLQKKFYASRKQKTGSSYLYNAMRKHPDYHDWSIAPLFEGIETREELDRWETRLIALYDTRNPDIGYNICKGGEGFTGKHSEESRKKSSEAAKSWYANPDNVEAVKAQRTKLSEQKKEQYADHWYTKLCPECGKEFTREPNLLDRTICCSHKCAYSYGMKLDPDWKKRQDEAKRVSISTPEYKAKLAASMAVVYDKQKQAARDAYYANPNHCVLCGSIIDIKNAKICVVRKREFCSRMCSNRFRTMQSFSVATEITGFVSGL